MDTKPKADDRVTCGLHPGVLGLVRYVNLDGDCYVEWRSAATHSFAWCDPKHLTVWRRAHQAAEVH